MKITKKKCISFARSHTHPLPAVSLCSFFSSPPPHSASAAGAGAALPCSASLGSVLRAPRRADGSVAATATPALGGGGAAKEGLSFKRSLSSKPDQ